MEGKHETRTTDRAAIPDACGRSEPGMKIRIDVILVERFPLQDGRRGYSLKGTVYFWSQRPRDRKCGYDQDTRHTNFTVTKKDFGQQSWEELMSLIATTKPLPHAKSNRDAWLFFYHAGRWYEPEF